MGWTRERARVASLSRSRAIDDPELIDARDALRVAVFENHIKTLVESAPPLTDEQRDKLAALLCSGGGPSEAT